MSKKHKDLPALCVAQLEADLKYLSKSPTKVDKCEVDYDDHAEDDYEVAELMREARLDAQRLLEDAAANIVKRASDPKRPRRSKYNMNDPKQKEAYEKARCAYLFHENLKRVREPFTTVPTARMGSVYFKEVPFLTWMEASTKVQMVLAEAMQTIEPHIAP